MQVRCPQLNPSDVPQRREIQFLRYKRASKIVFEIEFRYELDGYEFTWEGTWTAVVIKGRDKRERVQDIVVNIGSNITCDRASEVKNSYDVKGLLEEALGRSDREFEKELNRILNGEKRAYRKYDDLSLVGKKLVPQDDCLLPSPQPTEAKTDRLILDLGTWRFLLFSGRTVTFGRNCGLCDISWRHPNADRIEHDDPANIPYRKISGQQCSFEHRGDRVALIDGVRDERGIVKPSSYGTFFNAVRVEREKLLVSEGTGRGLVTFSDSAATGTLSVCLPNDVCAKCTRAERMWCGGGKRPSLVFKRLDGVPESAVMVWSCFRLEEVDPSFEGVKIFRSDGGFAWRRGRRCGWLVPGESIKTENGTVHVRHLPSPAEIAKEKNDVRNTSETCHS